MSKAESSATAAKNGIHAVGGASHDLPWYVPVPFPLLMLTSSQG